MLGNHDQDFWFHLSGLTRFGLRVTSCKLDRQVNRTGGTFLLFSALCHLKPDTYGDLTAMQPEYYLGLNMVERHTAYICVGSNLGNKLENCRRGVAELSRGETSRLVDQSPVYQTEPVDYKDQDWFVNYVVKMKTVLEPLVLLDRLKSIEQRAGRTPDSVRFGPRVLDLDIIFYDEMVMDHPRLVIPHPRMHKRRFVLKPVCDIDPHIHHPVLHRTMQSLLEDLDETGQRIADYK